MNTNLARLWRDRTGRHVTIVVAAKLCLLVAIWWAFVKDHRPEPDAGDVATAILQAAPTASTAAPEPGQ